MGSSFNSTTTPNFDNLLLQSLMGRLQIRPPNLHTPLTPPSPFLTSQSLEDLIFSDALLNLSDSDSENESDRTQLAKEESRLEKEIVRTVLSGATEKLKPNSGQAVTIGEHHICVGFHEETESDYRVWEWHGHIMLFDEENGYTPEYIYGNYFERVNPAKKRMEIKKESNDDDENKEDGKGKEKEEEKVGNLGLRELIESSEIGTSRILHRNLNANSASPAVSFRRSRSSETSTCALTALHSIERSSGGKGSYASEARKNTNVLVEKLIKPTERSISWTMMESNTGYTCYYVIVEIDY